MEKERIEHLMEKLKLVEGQEFRFGKLCEALGEETKKGTGKRNKFFNELAVCCQLEYNPDTKKYKVAQVYDEAIEMLELLSSKNQYQLLFEMAVYKACLENNGQPLYLSGMDRLRMFQEVNDNFSYACNRDIMNKIDKNCEYDYMPDIGIDIYRILNEWTKRRLKDMAGRHKIIVTDAYRLLMSFHVDEYDYDYIRTLDVASDSELEKECIEVYNKAIELEMPEDWGKTDKGKYWVGDVRWSNFQKTVRRLTREHFGKPFHDLKPIIKVSCASSQWLMDKIIELSKELNALERINGEACRKVLESKAKAFDEITQGQRKEFVEINMKPNPVVDFRQMLRDYNKKGIIVEE